MEERRFDLCVIGGGIVGLAVAYKYQMAHPQAKVAVLEKEAELGAHQTGRNSGVIHSGIYYAPGSFKARNCVSGRQQLVAFAQKYQIPHDICGKLIVATTPAEEERLEAIFERGQANGLQDLSLIGPQEIQAIEPYVLGCKAIRVRETGIIDYVAVCRKMAQLITEINPQSALFLNCEYRGAEPAAEGQRLQTSQGPFYSQRRIFCGGLQSDRLARAEGAGSEMAILGFRGDYYQLTPAALHKVKHLIYPVPDPDFPFLGVHFTRMTDGSVECGPNAVFSFKREGYSKSSFSWRDTLEALRFPGTLKLFRRHTAQGWQEMRRAYSKKLFLQALQKMIPSLTMDDIEPVRAGVRAQALQPDGSLVDDFKIAVHGDAVHVLNAPSPAATACLAIADTVLEHFAATEPSASPA